MAQFQAGFNARSSINSSPYVFQTYQARDMTPEADVTNSEGQAGNSSVGSTTPGNMAVIGTISHFECTVRNATFDLLSNPWSSPATISSRNYINLQIFPAGRSNASVVWGCSSFYVRESSQDGDVRQLQPVSFSGISDTAYSTP